jgi:CRISPR-associated protein Cas5t
MLGTYVTVPISCFRKGYAREFWETHPLPPPSTCYGFMLSLVGENGERETIDEKNDPRYRHVGCRLSMGLLNQPDLSVVLRTFWRIKSKAIPPGVGNNKTPGHHQLLSNVRLVIWLDSTDENRDKGPTLEERVTVALKSPTLINRFGGLSLGESSHLVNDVSILNDKLKDKLKQHTLSCFLLNEESGRLTLPVWVDHVGSAGTHYVVGDLVESSLEPPPLERMPVIEPPIPAA